MRAAEGCGVGTRCGWAAGDLRVGQHPAGCPPLPRRPSHPMVGQVPAVCPLGPVLSAPGSGRVVSPFPGSEPPPPAAPRPWPAQWDSRHPSRGRVLVSPQWACTFLLQLRDTVPGATLLLTRSRGQARGCLHTCCRGFLPCLSIRTRHPDLVGGAWAPRCPGRVTVSLVCHPASGVSPVVGVSCPRHGVITLSSGNVFLRGWR